MAYLKQQGRVVANIPLERIDHWLEENKLNRADFEIEKTPEEIRSGVRQVINQAADAPAREGVIADVSAAMVVGLASVIKAISDGKDLAGVKAAVQPLLPMADAVLSTLATAQDMKDPEAAIRTGKIVFPFMVKGGLSQVMADMATLANGVTSALISARRSS